MPTSITEEVKTHPKSVENDAKPHLKLRKMVAWSASKGIWERGRSQRHPKSSLGNDFWSLFAALGRLWPPFGPRLDPKALPKAAFSGHVDKKLRKMLSKRRSRNNLTF